MSVAVDIFGHSVGWRFLYATATAEMGCLVSGRLPSGPVGYARAAAASTGACQSCVKLKMSAAVDVFGHFVGGRFLYVAATAEVGCVVLARVLSGLERHAHAAAAPTRALLSCAECEKFAAVVKFGHTIGGRFLFAAATVELRRLVP